MGSEVYAAPFTDDDAVVVDKSLIGSHPSKKNQGKIPKRVHKAEREKMKREHLNDLFLGLANTLELTDPNNGKASILSETARIVKDTLAQIECLKRENAALLSESQYVTIEKNEIQDENSALQAQIEELQCLLKEGKAQSKLDLNETPTESQGPELPSYYSENSFRLPAMQPQMQQAPSVSPVFVIPICSDSQVYTDPDTAKLATKPVSNVSKPHARYPTPADSWPSQLLEKRPEAGEELQHS
ncbi:hypothetical protein RJ640_010584, partial [Escallonia rubra]